MSKYLKSSLLSEDSCLWNYNHNPIHIPCYNYVLRCSSMGDWSITTQCTLQNCTIYR